MWKFKSSAQDRRALTLIETMIAMTISALIILAMAQAFQTISETVVVNRASVELAGQLRAASTQLQRDLAGLTVPTRPWAETAGARGYFELYEGPGRDYDPTIIDPVLGFSDSSLGDVDDVLMFTSRNVAEPFSGVYLGRNITSNDAEIVWCVGGEDSNGSGRIESNERFVYRRALLIRPDLRFDPVFNDSVQDPTVPDVPNRWPNRYPVSGPFDQLRIQLEGFLRENDISVRIQFGIQELQPNNFFLVVGVYPNSLADLSDRRNRAGHYPILIDGPKLGSTRPSPRLVIPSDFRTQQGLSTYPVFPYPLDANPDSVTSIARLCSSDGLSGKSVVLSGALAFDLQVYDPSAEVYEIVTSSGENVATTPGDPGFPSVATRQNNPGRIVGYGAYVDLNYANKLALNGTVQPAPIRSVFSHEPRKRSLMSGTAIANNYAQPLVVCYDTWCLEYERDGVDQDVLGPLSPRNGLSSLGFVMTPSWLGDTQLRTDEGRNGLDDDGDGIVDDAGFLEDAMPPHNPPVNPGELETSPPYLAPLTGIRVRLRVMDFDTRLVQQNTVIVSLNPE